LKLGYIDAAGENGRKRDLVGLILRREKGKVYRRIGMWRGHREYGRDRVWDRAKRMAVTIV